jgi:glycosyltransferase involved in cell wall biosynthesis|tara:strand:- start:4 stop:840 length:837 start_codon:yes stop_codon:yes gene_type:complete
LKISVIIPTFNRKHTLQRAIDSVLAQTFKPYEIIIVDDGSKDGTKEWLLQNYPSVQYIHQPNNGVSSARNKGIQISQGSWIALLDSDDEWMPEKLEYQSRFLEMNRDSSFCHTNEIWIRNGVRVNQMKKHKKYGGDIFKHCLDICRISPSSSIIKKDVFEEVGAFDESLTVCEDYDLWLRVTAKFNILFLDEPLIKKYGGHLDQLSRVPEGIEQYRIRSLEKILSMGSLTETQFRSAKDMLIHKLNIYAKGLKKRDKYEELTSTEKKIQDWLIMPDLN